MAGRRGGRSPKKRGGAPAGRVRPRPHEAGGQTRPRTRRARGRPPGRRTP